MEGKGRTMDLNPEAQGYILWGNGTQKKTSKSFGFNLNFFPLKWIYVKLSTNVFIFWNLKLALESPIKQLTNCNFFVWYIIAWANSGFFSQDIFRTIF